MIRRITLWSMCWLVGSLLAKTALADDAIHAENMDRYKENLTEGQMTLLKSSDKITFRISTPGKGVAFLTTPDWVAYPNPRSGEAVMWNHLTRYRGNPVRQTVKRTAYSSSEAPAEEWEFVEEYLFAHYKDSGAYERLMRKVKNPAHAKGEVVLFHRYVDPSLDAQWQYLPGVRRLRRGPGLVFDAPDAHGGIKTLDMNNMFSGSMNRYEWRIAGQKLFYFPKTVVADALAEPEAYSLENLPGFVLTPVYVVEARLKDGRRHIYPFRIYYVDASTWQILWSEHHNADMKCILVAMAGYIYHPQQKAVIQAGEFVYNLDNHSYLVEMNGKYEFLPKDALPESYFTINSERRDMLR